MSDNCNVICNKSSYCMTNKNPQVCHVCDKPCSGGTGPPKPPAKNECATKCRPGSYCQKGVCHGCPGTTCGTGPPKPPGPPSDRPGPSPVPCTEDEDCNQGQWQFCRKRICASSPIPNHAYPAIASATVRPTEDDLTALAKSLHGGVTTPPVLPWKAPASGRSYRLTLWHEGVKGAPLTSTKALVDYMDKYIEFVKAKQFDRTFFQGGDPAMLDNYGYQKFPYADIDFLVDNYLAKLPSYTTAGLLAIIDPKYIGYYAYKTTGGIWGNNPGYKNPIADQTNYCQTPYRECMNDSGKCANMVPIPGKPPCDPARCAKNVPGKPYCDASGCSKYKPCDTIKDYCPKGTCCAQYPVGCPNTLEQFFKYVGDLNDRARKKGVNKVITTIALDGEDFGLYGTDKYGLVQAWQAAKKYAPDVNEIGYAHGPHTRARENWTNASYPEMYWIGELENDVINCVGCKEGATRTNPTCMNCLKAIYQEHRNKPQAMLDAFSKYLDPISPSNNSLSLPGTCPLLSIELAHIDKIGITPEKTCIKNEFDNNGFCGTFDGFGNWDWSKFEEFMNLFAAKYGAKEIGVYEFQFVPPAWLKNSGKGHIHTGSSGGCCNLSKKGKHYLIIGIVVSVILLLGLGAYFLFRRKKKM